MGCLLGEVEEHCGVQRMCKGRNFVTNLKSLLSTPI